jgi:hypothetical protein
MLGYVLYLTEYLLSDILGIRTLQSVICHGAFPYRYCDLASSPELENPSPIAFRWSTDWRWSVVPQSLSFRRCFQPCFATGLCLSIQSLRHRGRPAHFTDLQYLDHKLAALIGHSQRVPCMNLARRLSLLTVGEDSPEITSTGSY